MNTREEKMTRGMSYYKKLNYDVRIIAIPEEEGGGFEASIPQLGSALFRGIGRTRGDSLKDLDNIKSVLFKEYLETGKKIPEPENETFGELSGKILLRIPKRLHENLVHQAKSSEVSLNQWINYLLVRANSFKECSDLFNEIQPVQEFDLQYNFSKSTFPNTSRLQYISLKEKKSAA